MEPIIATVDYEWKPGAYEICKIFGHSCKVLVKASTLLAENMLKIKKKWRDALQACSSPIIIVERITSTLIVTTVTKSVT